MGHLNVNFVSNKYNLVENIAEVFDVFLISESKRDSTFFPKNQFYILDHKVARRDFNRFGCGLMLHINENVDL